MRPRTAPKGSGDEVVPFGLSVRAASVNARSKWEGNAFPRFAARRRIPAQARGLKKYRCGRPPVSKISDNEDAAPSLGYSEVLSVKNSVGEPIPELAQESEDGSKRPPSVVRQDAGHVLPKNPTGANSASQGKKLEREVAARIVESRSKTGDRETLARRSSHEKVDWSNISSDLGEVAEVRCVGPALGQERRSERLYLGEPCGLPAERLPCDRGGFDAGADGAEDHVSSSDGGGGFTSSVKVNTQGPWQMVSPSGMRNALSCV